MAGSEYRLGLNRWWELSVAVCRNDWHLVVCSQHLEEGRSNTNSLGSVVFDIIFSAVEPLASLYENTSITERVRSRQWWLILGLVRWYSHSAQTTPA